MRVLVTGASGFVGSNFLDFVLHKKCDVTALIRPTSSTKYLSTKQVHVLRNDFGNSNTALPDLSSYDFIFHFAAVLHAKTLHEFQSINLETSLRLYQTYSDHNPNGTFVHCSSLAAQGPSRKVMTENDLSKPLNFYGQSKLQAEQALKALGGNRLIILRPPAVYGPREKDIYLFFKMAKIGFLPFLGGRDQRVSFCHVQDLAKAAWHLSQKENLQGTYLISDGESYNGEEITRVFSEVFQKKLKSFFLPKALTLILGRASEVFASLVGKYPVFNVQKALDLTASGWACSNQKLMDTGFEPNVSFRHGIESTYLWYRENGWL